jgi:hypothetical protein
MPRRRSLPIEITGGDVDVPSRATTWTEMPVEGKPGSPAAAPEQLTEERLKEEEYDQMTQMILPLKNGAGQMRLVSARAAQEELRLLLQHEPELFAALRALVEGRVGEVRRDQHQALMEGGYLTRSGGVRGDLKAIMTAGFRETDVGPVIEEPLDLTNPEHAAIVHQRDQKFQQMLHQSRPRIRLLLAELKARSKGNDKGEGRSP